MHAGYYFSIHCYEKCWPRIKNCTHCDTCKCSTQLAPRVSEMETIGAKAFAHLHAWRCFKVCFSFTSFIICLKEGWMFRKSIVVIRLVVHFLAYSRLISVWGSINSIELSPLASGVGWIVCSGIILGFLTRLHGFVYAFMLLSASKIVLKLHLPWPF